MDWFMCLPTPPAQTVQIESKKQFLNKDDKWGIKLIQTANFNTLC